MIIRRFVLMAHGSPAAFAPALLGLFALFGGHVLPAFAPVLTTPPAASPAPAAEAASEQSAQHHQPDGLEKSEGGQSEDRRCQVVPEQHGDEGKNGDENQPESQGFECPFPFHVLHIE